MEQEEKYDEKALSRILKRAAELEAESGKAERSSGYSLGEIESIASDMGRSPARSGNRYLHPLYSWTTNEFP